MIVTCPSCATRYLVDSAALGEAGRTVRCARCAHAWLELPQDDTPESPFAEREITPAIPRPIPPGSNLPVLPRRQRSRAWIGWLAAATIVIAVVGGGVVERNRVMEAWPPTVRFYAMIGLSETLEMQSVFELRNVQQSTFIEDERTVVVITGEIANVSRKVHAVPQLIAQVFDKENRVLKKWAFKAVSAELGPGESTVFSDRLADPPRGAVNLLVSLDDGA